MRLCLVLVSILHVGLSPPARISGVISKVLNVCIDILLLYKRPVTESLYLRFVLCTCTTSPATGLGRMRLRSFHQSHQSTPPSLSSDCYWTPHDSASSWFVPQGEIGRIEQRLPTPTLCDSEMEAIQPLSWCLKFIHRKPQRSCRDHIWILLPPLDTQLVEVDLKHSPELDEVHVASRSPVFAAPVWPGKKELGGHSYQCMFLNNSGKMFRLSLKYLRQTKPTWKNKMHQRQMTRSSWYISVCSSSDHHHL